LIRISSTILESYRRLIETEWGDEQELIAQVMGEPFTPSWQMQAGTAWHSVVAGPWCGEAKWVVLDGRKAEIWQSGNYWFAQQDVAAANKLIGPGLWEIKAVKVLDCFGCPVQIVAKADHVRGLVIQDNKTRWGKPDDARDREASLQWRLYLLAHEAAVFQYNVFCFKEPDGGGYCELRDALSYRFWPYAHLELDCKRWVASFLDWAHLHRLTEYLDRPDSNLEIA